MELYIGGRTQGKLDYVLAKKACALDCVIEEDDDFMVSLWEEKYIINHFHTWFRHQLIQGHQPEAQMQTVLETYPDVIVISDEVGNGIVPLDPFEREYRERLGRCLCFLASKANVVERIFCGIGQRIK